MRLASAVLASAILCLTLGCGSPTSDGGAASPSMASDSASPATSSPKPATSRAAATPASDTLTGYGALREDWDASHAQAPGMTQGAAFLPMVNGEQPKYAAVSGDPGERILSYEIYFEDGTPLEIAKRIVLQEFPAGAKLGVADDDESQCLILEVRSAPVERVMDGYRPIAGFFSDPEVSDDLDPARVHSASMIVAGPDEKTDLGMC